MLVFRQRQTNRLIPTIIVLAGLVTTVSIVLTSPAMNWAAILIAVLAFAIGILFGRQFGSFTIEVDDEELHWWFGDGFWHKRVSLSDIASAEAVRNNWWWGWGIRYYGKGWLYNVSGLDAVEVVLRSGKHTRLGTDDPHTLILELEKRSAHKRP